MRMYPVLGLTDIIGTEWLMLSIALIDGCDEVDTSSDLQLELRESSNSYDMQRTLELPASTTRMILRDSIVFYGSSGDVNLTTNSTTPTYALLGLWALTYGRALHSAAATYLARPITSNVTNHQITSPTPPRSTCA
eukprot:scaffold1887_cov67-Skeletonema_dohrnii-CCMP3373.AAC.1